MHIPVCLASVGHDQITGGTENNHSPVEDAPQSVPLLSDESLAKQR